LLRREDIHYLVFIHALGLSEKKLDLHTGAEYLLKQCRSKLQEIEGFAEVIAIVDQDVYLEKDVCDSYLCISPFDNPRRDTHQGSLSFLRNISSTVKSYISKKPFSMVIILDATNPFLENKVIENAVSLFQSSRKKMEDIVVASVVPVANHYHPRKILKLDDDGSLSYFEKSGIEVYQRQQLAQDEYLVVNNALFVVDTSCLISGNYESENIVCVKMQEEALQLLDMSSFLSAEEYLKKSQ